MSREEPKEIYHAQQGFVLIIVVSILTVIIALIAIGFSKLSDRELRQASNRELSSQAYYAAQSGINDAIAYIRDDHDNFSGCSWPTPTGDRYFTKDLSGGSNIAKYSCISVDKTPKTLPYTVTPGEPLIVKVDATNLEDLYIGWENSPDSGPPAFFASGPSFGRLPDYASLQPKQTGVLRTQIYSVDRDGVPADPNSYLESLSRVYYLYPDQGTGIIDCTRHGPQHAPDPEKGCVDYTKGDYTTGSPTNQNGIFVSGECQNNNPDPKPDPSHNNLGSRTYCNSEISQLDGLNNTYYLYFTAQYAPLKVVIQGTDSLGLGHPVQFTGAQAVIDVTGQAADQIQRVRARVELTPQASGPNYAVQSIETLCKAFLMQILPGNQYTVGSAPGASHDTTACAGPTNGTSPIIPDPNPNNAHY